MESLIERVFNELDITKTQREDCIKLFTAAWYDFYYSDKEPNFSSYELIDLWFYIKVRMLIDLASYRNLKAMALLRNELNYNARKYENPEYRTDLYKKKKEALCAQVVIGTEKDATAPMKT